MDIVLLLILMFLFLVWFFAPAYTALTLDWNEFIIIYPNKWKQLIVIFLHGPSVWIVFGSCWLMEHSFGSSKKFKKFKLWLRS